MMVDWMKEKIEMLKGLFSDYGKLILTVVGVMMIAVCLIFINIKTREGELAVTFFDVGQGDSIFIQTPSGKEMLIDGGPNDKVLQGLDREMSMNDKNIDVVVVTHADADHVTGLIPVLERYKVSHIIESLVAGHTSTFNDLENHIKSENANVHIGKTGDVIDFSDGVMATILYPSANYIDDKKTNEASVSILLTYLDKSFLLTGDLPTTREWKLIESNLLSNGVTVYKAGHHGSKTSSSDQLLSYIKPYYSVISAGKDNRYGHPNIETLDRLRKYGKVILSTIESGDIKFVLGNNSFKFEVEK